MSDTESNDDLIARAEKWATDSLPPGRWGDRHIVHELIARAREANEAARVEDFDNVEDAIAWIFGAED